MRANDFSHENINPTVGKPQTRVLIISDVRLLRESLAEVFTRAGMASISGLFADLQEALPRIIDNQPDIILLDEAILGGPAAVGQIQHVAPQIPVIVIAVTEFYGGNNCLGLGWRCGLYSENGRSRRRCSAHL